ncbi:hypothetical protein BaRGS_00022916 [Batillaria attramentaria]|uniref:Uncharacterized protein n=1 Tax=Batillaria attramentaria TaxID=370345 RepID=A0ABD0KF69_9CAEN
MARTTWLIAAVLVAFTILCTVKADGGNDCRLRNKSCPSNDWTRVSRLGDIVLCCPKRGRVFYTNLFGVGLRCQCSLR